MVFNAVDRRLAAIKLAHTLIWAVFAGAILLIPVAVWLGERMLSLGLVLLVLIEVVVLAINGWRCPLTDVAADYTTERQDNFDIYLPLWLARYNKLIFGAMYLGGVALVLVREAGLL